MATALFKEWPAEAAALCLLLLPDPLPRPPEQYKLQYEVTDLSREREPCMHNYLMCADHEALAAQPNGHKFCWMLQALGEHPII